MIQLRYNHDKKGDKMSVQTELKQETEIFALLSTKILKSKTADSHQTRIKEINKFKFDTFDVEFTYCEDNCTNEYFDEDTIHVTNSSNKPVHTTVDTIVVKDKAGKRIFVCDCKPYDVEGEAFEIQKFRYNAAKRLLSVINRRMEQEEEKKRKQEELQKAQQRVIASKKLREKQLQDQAATAQALQQIKDL